MRKNFRIWWPKQLSSEPSSNDYYLFGWFISSSSASIDVVVAFWCSKVSLSGGQSSIQEIVYDTNGRMPVCLQEQSCFRLLGQCSAPLNSNGESRNVSVEEENEVWSSPHSEESVCGCNHLDGFGPQCGKNGGEGDYWIHLIHSFSDKSGGGRIPQLHHVHWKGQEVVQCSVHVILYDIPVYGVQHFTMNHWTASKQPEATSNKLKWVDELQKRQSVFDMDATILAMNCASAARKALERHIGSDRSCPIKCMYIFYSVSCFSVESNSLFLSITFHYNVSDSSTAKVSMFGWGRWICVRPAKLFHTTWRNIEIRCSQIIYWPIFLEDNSIRLRACVEYAERAALRRHSMWTSLLVDLLFGNLVALVLFSQAESVWLWVSFFAKASTNEILRSGCVWLMGVPAGFKLNTELAGILGMISLNAIQIWSTLWVFIDFLVIYFIKGLAVLGTVSGITIPAALAIDIVGLGKAHVSALHWCISLLYYNQIQALGAIWRLFRGRKKNPLRQRLDSYDYTVKQHVVGSLLFTPLLLLLPTTSVFYIFFTILNTAITMVCTMIDVTISMIHGTPYFEIFLWLSRRSRFPSGIWFEISSCSSDGQGSAYLREVRLPKEGKETKTTDTIVSVLHSNYLSIGDLVLPRYREVFSGVSGFLITSRQGALTGIRSLGVSFSIVYPPELRQDWIPSSHQNFRGCLYLRASTGALLQVSNGMHARTFQDATITQDVRNNKTALFDGIEEGGIRASSSYSHEINEQDNESALEGLQDRVNLLKRLSGDINEEVEGHNRMLDGMGNDMDASRGVLSGTMDRFKMVFETKSSRRMATLVASFLLLFLIVYYLTR
ncbi:Bet1-like SNARE 1-1 [Linum grandiflorum]